ncbi:unnamed protein product, partial [Diamesa hyperborea]
ANLSNPLSNSAGWIGDSETPLTGFSWRSGVDRDTTGLILWSDVFLYDAPNSEKLAIILMDTQGLFDNQTTIADNSKIFALGTLLSSVQILNLFSIIQEDHLQYLQFATEFAKFASNSSAGGKPFQSFMFLIRDWNNPDEYEFGNVGGVNYMNKVLTAKPDQSPELKSVREFIKASFDKLGCCLMPYPGKDVARNKEYDGRWAKMDEDFLNELKLVIPSLLAPENLVVKKINGVEMNSNLLNEFIQSSFALFRSNQLPEAQSIFESTVDKYMMTIVAKCVEVYNSNALNSKSTIIDEASVGTVHEFSKSKAMLAYAEEKKMGNDEHIAKYKTILESQIEVKHTEWRVPAIAQIVTSFKRIIFNIYNLQLNLQNLHPTVVLVYESVSNTNLINHDGWLGDENEPLTGFSWKSGTDRDTTGLVLWSDVFLYDAPNGEKLAIYLMDTQGLFDHQTTTADNSRIFSLSTLISSVQILNLFNIIHEDQLQYLQFATEFARYASESKTNSKSFQNLLILIRDWNNPAVHSFGFRGGKQYLKNFLEIKDDQKPELKSVRRYLGSAFESINCFLMPHPGKSVARDSTYDGNWADIDEEFVESMNELFPALLGPKKLKTKIINGNAIKPAELIVFIKTYVEQFKSGEIPAAQSIYESTLDKQFQILMGKSVDIYIDFIKNKQTELNNENDINNLHNEAKAKALLFFGAEKKFGTYSEGAEFKSQLKNKVEVIFEQWKSVALVHIKKLAQEKVKTKNQVNQRDLAQNRNNLAAAELDEAVRKAADANTELNKARQDTEAARRESEVLKVKLEQAEAAPRADAVARQQETLILLEEMKQKTAMYEKQLSEHQAAANNNVGSTLEGEQKNSGFAGVLLQITGIVSTVASVFTTISGLFVPQDAHPVELLNFKNETVDKLELNLETLEALFLDVDVADRNVVVISIVGAFRKGKSFLLNYLLRFMYANYRSTGNPNATFNMNETMNNWLGDEHEPLKGFPWKSSTTRETTGIKFWSDVFLYDAPNGQKIAIYLMDTQGLFDHESSPTDNARIFSLSTLISSAQILNLFSNIQEDNLEYLQFATEYARFAGIEDNNGAGKPFQNLMFVIRDWSSPDDYEYGLDGGNRFLKSFLQIREFHTPELKSIRQYMEASFDKLNCFLMPYPGKIVARNSTYDGSWSDIDEEFVDAMKELFPVLLAPENLTLKTVNNKLVKAYELSKRLAKAENDREVAIAREEDTRRSLYEIRKKTEFYEQQINQMKLQAQKQLKQQIIIIHQELGIGQWFKNKYVKVQRFFTSIFS